MAVIANIGQRRHRYIAIAVTSVILAALISAIIEPPVLPASAAASPAASAPAGLAPVGVQAIPSLVGMSLLTALVEELVFRGVLLRAVLRVCTPKATILVTAAVFASLHAIPVGIQGNPAMSYIIASLLLKFFQALAFGIIFAAILFCGGSLPGVIALHAAFDCIYFASSVLATGDFPTTYVVTDPASIGALAASTLIMAVPAACAIVAGNASSTARNDRGRGAGRHRARPRCGRDASS